ncbi:MAG: phytoene/squalene synthase family protein [Myxococcales bacterium]|nr:phytoene/squalene synthase family protein [Myxococcales bacterium]
MSPEVVALSREVLAKYARTFDLAGAFLPPARLDDAAVVYAFCRLVDDAIDEAPELAVGLAEVAAIEAELRGEAPARPLVAGLVALADARGIELRVFEELIAGVRADASEVRIADDRGLVRYCYRVAGTVGLMMCGVVGIAEREALPFAIDLGIGMQITNICRDVAEDAGRGRIYLPASRLRAAGVDPATLLDGTVDRRRLAIVVGDLLALAERYYASADRGMAYIPARSRLAILIASRVYRAIGRRLDARGGDPMGGRTVVPAAGKARWIAAALGAFGRRRSRRAGGLQAHDPWLHAAIADLPGADPRAAELGAALLEDPRGR